MYNNLSIYNPYRPVVVVASSPHSGTPVHGPRIINFIDSWVYNTLHLVKAF